MEKLAYILGRSLNRGWLATPLEGGWQLHRQGIEIFLQETAHWFSFTRLLTEGETAVPGEGQDRVNLYQRLLLRNRSRFMTHFAIDDQGQLLLQSEVPRHNTGSMLFDIALEAMSRSIALDFPGTDQQSLGPQQELATEEEEGLPLAAFSLYMGRIRLQMWGLGTSDSATTRQTSDL